MTESSGAEMRSPNVPATLAELDALYHGRCACLSSDARRCIEYRYGDDDGEPCECACHERDEDYCDEE
jgi:hypothetical protein